MRRKLAKYSYQQKRFCDFAIYLLGIMLVSKRRRIFSNAVTVAVIASLIFGGSINPHSVSAATYSFSQSDWSGGSTTSTIAHPTNQTGWAQYSTSTNISVPSSTIRLTEPWWNLTWANRKSITLNNASSSSSLSDFPVAVFLNSSNFDYSKTVAGGADIRFVSSDNATPLSYEIESWNTSGTSTIWVKVPTITADNNTSIYLYYNNPSAQSSSSASAVWNSNFLAVYHLNDGNSTTTIVDSKGARNGVKTSTTAPSSTASAIIAGGQRFDNTTNSEVQVSSTALGGSSLTVSAWVKPISWSETTFSNVSANAGAVIFDTQTNGVVESPTLTISPMSGGAGTHQGLVFTCDKNSVANGAKGSTAISLGSWYYVAGTFSYSGTGTYGGSWNVYLNGLQDNASTNNFTLASTCSGNFGGSPWRFARQPMWPIQPEYSNIDLDEVRVSTVVRSADWLLAEYKTEINNFNTLGVEESPTYSLSGNIVSSAYDSGDSGNVIGSLSWIEDVSLPAGTAVTVSLRTASSSSNLSLVGWSDFTATTTGCSKNSGTVSCPSAAIPSILSSGNNDRWFQYKVALISTGVSTPTVLSVTVQYVVNASPEFNQSFGTNGIAANQNATSTDSAFGQVAIEYAVRDPDTTTGTTDPGYVTPSFEYSINNGSTWASIATSTLVAADYAHKAVAQVAYTTQTATWNAKAQLGSGTYSSTTKIRITVNDREGANNTTSTIGGAFTLDTTNPAVSSFVLNIPSSTITLAATDNTNIQYRVSSTVEAASSSSFVSVGGASTSTTFAWSFASTTYPTIYYEVRDLYGNMTSSTVSAPYAPANFQFKDVSNVPTGNYGEFVTWEQYVATSSAPFGSYKVYRSTNGTDYSFLTTLTASTTNYHYDQNLSSSTTYYYKVQTLSSNNDVSAYTPVLSDQPNGQGGSDTTSPTISTVSTTERQATWVRIIWDTDEISNSEINYSVSPSTAFGSTASSTAFATSHSVTITGLTASTTYLFRVKSTDPSLNTATSDNGGAGYSFSTLSAPTISGVTAINVNDNTATIFWNTNVDSDSYVYYSTNPQLSSATQVGSASLVGNGSSSLFQHQVNLTGLSAGTTYYYYVKSTDGNGATATDNNGNNYYFFATTNDVKAPTISNVSVPVKSSTAAVVVWTTDEPATSKAQYGTATGSYPNATDEDATLTISHVASLTGLTANTNYFFILTSKDAANNSTTSAENTFKTTESNVVIINSSAGGGAPPPPPKDSTAPTISNITVEQLGAFGATIKFETDENTTGLVYYGEDSKYGLVAADPVSSRTHAVKVTGLRLGTEYHFQVTASDKEGNTASSADQILKTKFFAESVKDIQSVENASAAQDLIESSIESILPSLIPPFIEQPRVIDIAESTATITWKTNTNAFGVVSYAPEEAFNAEANNPYGAEVSDLQARTRDHKLNLVGLKSNTRYHYMVKSFTLPQVVGKSDDLTFITKTGTAHPRIAQTLNNGFRIVWSTDEPASSIVTYKNLRTGEVNQKTDPQKVVDHEILIDNLTPATTYELTISGYNEKDNPIQSGDSLTARTSQDVTPPIISNIKIDNALVPGRNDRVQTVVSWKTDEPTNSLVLYQDGTAGAKADFKQIGDKSSYSTDHNVIITDLKPGQLYRVRIETADQAGNKTQSPVRTIITPRQSESIVDIVIKNFEETFNFLQKIR